MACKTSPTLAHDIRNLVGMVAGLASGEVHIPDEGGNAPKGAKAGGFWLRGPDDKHIEYGLVCRRRQAAGAFGHGTCSVIEITRMGPGVEPLGLRPSASVGNIHGLMDQLSRDMAKAYGCKLPPTRGFEGARRRGRK